MRLAITGQTGIISTMAKGASAERQQTYSQQIKVISPRQNARIRQAAASRQYETYRVIR